MRFEGYYIKCENVAVIFGANECGEDSSSFIQIITEDDSFYVKFDYKQYQANKNKFEVRLDYNYVDENGIYLDIDKDGLVIKGYVKFEKFTPLKYDIMGPFKYLPFMECKHFIISMRHDIFGEIVINNKFYNLDNKQGYIEGDKGKSFPSKYFWSQAINDDISVCTSCAIIPYLSLKFNGTICILNVKGKEYRLATYLGAKVLEFNKDRLVIIQGKSKLEVLVLSGNNSQTLMAPSFAKMKRRIKESVKHTVQYRFTKDGEVVFDFTTKNAAFEYSSL